MDPARPNAAAHDHDREHLVHAHLVNHHGRRSLELVAALDAVHRLEHVDAELGLLVLDHTHHG